MDKTTEQNGALIIYKLFAVKYSHCLVKTIAFNATELISFTLWLLFICAAAKTSL